MIADVDAEKCKIKFSRERGMMGRRLYSPVDLNSAFKRGFESLGWEQRRVEFYVTANEDLMVGFTNGLQPNSVRPSSGPGKTRSSRTTRPTS